jgi:outer membrane protein TolC
LRAEQAFEAARFAYEKGTGAFLEVLVSGRTLLDMRLAYDQAFTECLLAGAELDAAVGEQPDVTHE